MSRILLTAAALASMTSVVIAQPAGAAPNPDTKEMDPKGMDHKGMAMDGKNMDMSDKGMCDKEMGAKGMAMDMHMMMPSEKDPVSTAGYKAAMMKMMHAAPKFTGDADVDFMKQMRTHHQAAIDTANVVIEHGKESATKKLARRIVTAQTKEIRTIDAWLKKNPQ